MKKILIIILFLLTINLVDAHPGKYDKDGCHVCKTNCEKWGLKDGEYHCKTDVKVSDCSKKPGTILRESDNSCICPGDEEKSSWTKEDNCKTFNEKAFEKIGETLFLIDTQFYEIKNIYLGKINFSKGKSN